MQLPKLKYLSEIKTEELRNEIADNLDRYTQGDFNDLAQHNGWEIELGAVTVDHNLLTQMDGSKLIAELEQSNSMLVFQALKGMTPALAREERIWVRLCHVECLEYSRQRWLQIKNMERLKSAISKHLFARTLTGIRDDNAVSRLWWNAYVAHIARPEDPESALAQIARTADIRQAIVERPNTASRPELIRGIIRISESENWLTDKESNYREFMKVLNRDGGGILFEAMDQNETAAFLERCIERAKKHLE